MLRGLCASLAGLALVLSAQAAPAAGRVPSRIGECTRTTIREIGHRLEDGFTHVPMIDSGSAVTFANGLYQVSYEELPVIHRARRGDPVLICLVSLPTDCPKGDDRGKVYKTTDLRTRQSWTLPDAEHSCGGA